MWNSISNCLKTCSSPNPFVFPNKNEETYDSPEVTKLDYCYKMDHNKRGIALIFNHEHFLGPYDTRRGTKFDRDRLQKTYTDLGFDVRIHDNCSFDKMENILTTVSKMDYSDYDCFIVTILSHGHSTPHFDEQMQSSFFTILSHDLNSRINAHDGVYYLQTIFRYFSDENCPSMRGKPRLFFIQACQGDEKDAGFKMQPQNQGMVESDAGGFSRAEDRSLADRLSTFLPHKDFLIAFSTLPGYVSFRSPFKGSWFIQTLCDAIEQRKSTDHLLIILTLVAQGVSFDYESYSPSQPENNEKKQVPFTISNLPKLLFFPRCDNI